MHTLSSGVWQRILISAAQDGDYLALLSMQQVSRTHYHHVHNGYIWYCIYQTLFCRMPKSFTSLSLHAWRPYVLYLIMLRVRWHRHHLHQSHLWQVVLRNANQPFISSPSIVVNACVCKRSLPMDAYQVLELDAQFKADGYTAFMDSTGTHIAQVVPVPRIPDKVRPMRCIDSATGTMMGVFHGGDDYMQGMWFYHYTTVHPAMTTLSFSQIAQPFGLSVQMMRFCKIVEYQDAFYLLGVDHPSGYAHVIRFSMDPEACRPVFTSVHRITAHKAIKLLPLQGHADMFLFIPKDAFHSPQVWSLEQLDEPVAYLTGLDTCEKLCLDVHVESTTIENSSTIRLVSHGERTVVWTLQRSSDHQLPVMLEPCTILSHSITSAQQLVACHEGLKFILLSDNQLCIKDISGAGQVIWDPDYDKWRVTSPSELHIICTLSYPPNRFFAKRDASHVHLTCLDAAYRMRLDGI